MGTETPSHSPEHSVQGERKPTFDVPEDLRGTEAFEPLKAALRQFDAGDHAVMRKTLAPLLKHEDERVRALAETLMGRLHVDPMQMGVVAACVAFLGIIVYRYFL